MPGDPEDTKNETTASPADTALDIASVVAGVIPWLGGPISSVLSGISVGRKFTRVKEAIEGLAEDLRAHESEASMAYVRTEDFADLLETALRQVAGERHEEKRRMYRDFLVGAIKTPGEPFDEQRRFLRVLDELEGDHLRLLKALGQRPESETGTLGSPSSTLRHRLPDMSADQIAMLVQQLNDFRLTDLRNLNIMMTAQGAADLRHSITAFGRRLVKFLLK